MKPRVFLLTHYQVCRPGIFSYLIVRSTAPDRSQAAHSIASHLYRGFKGTAFKLSVRAAEEAVKMAVGYGYLTPGGFWSPKGHVVSALAARRDDAPATEFLELHQGEILAHLKYYLQTQGHLALQCGEFILRENKVSGDTLKKEPLLERWLEAAYRWSLSTTSEISERVRLRGKIKELSSAGGRYKPDVRWHKLSPIVWSLVDFGLLETTTEGDPRRSRYFRPKITATMKPLATLLCELSSFDALEDQDKRGTLLKLISGAYGFKLSVGTETDFAIIFPPAYLKVRMLPTGMASLAALYDICCIRSILDQGTWLSPTQVLSSLEALQARFPGEVRFQYDRTGQKSSVIVTDVVLKCLADQASSVLRTT